MKRITRWVNSNRLVAFRTSNKRGSISISQNVVTPLTRYAWAGQVLRLRLGLTACSTKTFRLGSAQDDGLRKEELVAEVLVLNRGVAAADACNHQ